jgi:hypothetical protein
MAWQILTAQTEGYVPSRPLQFASAKFEENMNVCPFSCCAVLMSSMKCKKSMNVCLSSCNAMPYIVLAMMCIHVIYKCLSWHFDLKQDLGKPS